MNPRRLDVYVKSEELLYKIYPILVHFPKSERYALCQTMKNEFFELLKYLSLANSVKSKRLRYAQEADGHLRVIVALLELSKKRRYITEKKLTELRKDAETIGKILSGYIRATAKNK